jgi:hypothetical protein
MVLLLHGIMRAGERGPIETDSPIARANRGRGPIRARREARQEKTAGAARILSLFLAVLAAALLVGGHLVIDPLLKAAADVREARRLGDITSAVPDGAICRQRSLDNATGGPTEGVIEKCAGAPSKEGRHIAPGFSSGAPRPGFN